VHVAPCELGNLILGVAGWLEQSESGGNRLLETGIVRNGRRWVIAGWASRAEKGTTDHALRDADESNRREGILDGVDNVREALSVEKELDRRADQPDEPPKDGGNEAGERDGQPAHAAEREVCGVEHDFEEKKHDLQTGATG